MNKKAVHLGKSVSEKKILSYQTETQRLETEVEELTRKLEQERRLSILLSKDLEEITAMLGGLSSKHHKKIKGEWKKKSNNKAEMLESELEREFKRLSELKNSNKKLQDRIETLRKDKGSLLKSNNQLQLELLSAGKLKKSENEVSSFNFNRSENNQSRITRAQETLSSARVDYSQKISLLSSKILEGRQSEAKYLKGITVNFAEPTANASEIYQIAKNQAKYWKTNCIEINEKSNMYSDFVTELNSGMETMKNQCEIQNHQEIVDLFVASFDENARLSQYMYELGEEISVTKKDIENNKNQIKGFNEVQKYSEGTKVEKISKINEELRKIVENIAVAKDRYKKLQSNMESVLYPISEIQEILKDLGFNCKSFGKEVDISDIKIIEEHINGLLLVASKNNENIKKEAGSKSPLKFLEIDSENLTEPDEGHHFFTVDEFRNRALKTFDQIKTER
ncbi:unnamed protein product [Blepharisma stoltei]|uniref:ODAD1 central coiled coil region domain-containing protein n=1 Tax=Blepharisma stoltei TaxID=1481888 RepID=A0AAU9JF68_9CILI|nr:unnamed protein product [Blepharisma stoltei]